MSRFIVTAKEGEDAAKLARTFAKLKDVACDGIIAPLGGGASNGFILSCAGRTAERVRDRLESHGGIAFYDLYNHHQA